jgi:hypothetical protein
MLEELLEQANSEVVLLMLLGETTSGNYLPVHSALRAWTSETPAGPQELAMRKGWSEAAAKALFKCTLSQLAIACGDTSQADLKVGCCVYRPGQAGRRWICVPLQAGTTASVVAAHAALA